jgi:hypothetical protein
MRSPNWDFAQHLDKLAGDIMDTRCRASSSCIWGTAHSTPTCSSTASDCPKIMKSNYKNNFKNYLVSHLNLPFHYVGGNIDLTDYSHIPGSPSGS